MSVDVFHQKNGKRSTFTKHWPAWSKRITGLAGKYYLGFLKNIFLKLGMRSLCAMAHRGPEITKNLKKHVLEEDSGPPTPPGRSREANRPQKRCQNHHNEAQREPNGHQNHKKSQINYPLQQALQYQSEGWKPTRETPDTNDFWSMLDRFLIIFTPFWIVCWLIFDRFFFIFGWCIVDF